MFDRSEPGWRRTNPPLASSYSPKLATASLEVRNRAVLGYIPSFESASIGAFSSCILLWAFLKMQLFLCEKHRSLSFSTGRTTCMLFGLFLQSQKHDAQHLVEGSGLSGPDLELPGCLMNEHLNPRNDLRPTFLGQFQQPCFGGIVDHIKDIARIDFFLLQGRFTGISHAHRRRIDNHVKSQLLQIRPLYDPRSGLMRQLLGRSQTAVEDI